MKLTTLTIIKELMEEAIKSTDKNAKDYTARLTKLKTQLDELSEESPFAEFEKPYKELKPLVETAESEYKTLLSMHSKLKIAYQDFITHDFS